MLRLALLLLDIEFLSAWQRVGGKNKVFIHPVWMNISWDSSNTEIAN